MFNILARFVLGKENGHLITSWEGEEEGERERESLVRRLNKMRYTGEEGGQSVLGRWVGTRFDCGSWTR